MAKPPKWWISKATKRTRMIATRTQNSQIRKLGMVHRDVLMTFSAARLTENHAAGMRIRGEVHGAAGQAASAPGRGAVAGPVVAVWGVNEPAEAGCGHGGEQARLLRERPVPPPATAGGITGGLGSRCKRLARRRDR
jgi:hypothetical protein